VIGNSWPRTRNSCLGRRFRACRSQRLGWGEQRDLVGQESQLENDEPTVHELRITNHESQFTISGCSGLVNKAVVYGVKGKLEAIGNTQFVEDIVEVIFYGLLADEELFADLFVPVTLRHELDDFLLAVA
jgi:hypothetical protein